MAMALKIAVLCVATAVICVAIRVHRPEIALVTALAAGIAACVLALDGLKTTAQAFQAILNRTGVSDENTALILKVCGLALIGEYASALCRDAGENALAQRVDFGMRISLISLIAPLAARTVGEIAGMG